MNAVLVLEPDTGFPAVAHALAGWEGGAVDQRPWLGGEPIAARWTRDGASVSYSCNPAIALRVLEVDAPRESVAQLSRRLSVLDPRRARALARSPDTAAAVLGTTAIGLYADVTAVGLLEKLVASAVPELSGAARLALGRVVESLLATGAERIAERRRAAGDRDPLLGLGPSDLRRQVMRQLAARPPGDRRRQLEVVRSGLADDDWEVRWSALLAAGDLGLHELARQIRHCRLSDRIDRTDRQILEATRHTVGGALTGTVPRHPGAAHLRACLSGRPERYDRAFLLLYALRHAVPAVPVGPAPPGFCWVPAVPHWLGDDLQGSAPVRAVQPGTGFAIAAKPLPEVAAQQVPRRLEEDATAHGLPLRLPSAEELEMAVRGPDGRRYPWGNGREPGWRRATSPWGLVDPVSAPQWALRGGELVALGGSGGRCAGPWHLPAAARLRPVAAMPQP